MSSEQKIEELGLSQLEEALRLCYTIFKWIFILLVIAFLFSGVHKVPPGKVAYIQRLGKWLPEAKQSGYHFAWPFMIDRVYQFDVSTTRTIVIEDFVPLEKGTRDLNSHRVLISSDHNLIHAKWSLSYKLDDPIACYRLFGHLNKEEEDALMKEIFKGICVREVASRDVKTLLGNQEEIKNLVKEGVQKYFNQLKMGCTVMRVDLVELHVPGKVKSAFDLVFAEAATKKEKINNARNEASKLERSIQAIKEERLGQARALASKIRNSLKADANNIKSLIKQLEPGDRGTYLESKLLSAMERAFTNNEQQMYFLREGSELRLKLSSDPQLDKIHRERRREAEELEKSGAKR